MSCAGSSCQIEGADIVIVADVEKQGGYVSLSEQRNDTLCKCYSLR